MMKKREKIKDKYEKDITLMYVDDRTCIKFDAGLCPME